VVVADQASQVVSGSMSNDSIRLPQFVEIKVMYEMIVTFPSKYNNVISKAAANPRATLRKITASNSGEASARSAKSPNQAGLLAETGNTQFKSRRVPGPACNVTHQHTASSVSEMCCLSPQPSHAKLNAFSYQLSQDFMYAMFFFTQDT